MKKHIVLFIAAILTLSPPLAASVGGKTSLRGKVTDKTTHQPIIGATIYIVELKSGVVSDIDGNYRVNNLPRHNDVLVQVSFIGYKNLVANINLATDTIRDFAMEPAVTELSQVVVTGSSQATEAKESPIPITTIDKTYIEQNQGTNIIDDIAKVPGVSAVTTGPNISKPFIHGLGYDRILTLFDGVRNEGQQWGDEHGIEMDEYAIDHVEIIKGPASLTYGSDALGGVVNLLPPLPPPEGHIMGDLLLNYQTNNRLIANSEMLTGNQNGIVWEVRHTEKLATNYTDKIDGRVYNTGFHENDYSGMVGLSKGWGISHLSFDAFDDLQEIPDGSRDSLTRQFTKQITEIDTFRPIVTQHELNSYDISVLHQHVQHYRALWNNVFFLGKGKLEINLGYQLSIRREYAHPEEPLIPGLYLFSPTTTYDIKYSLPDLKGWKATVGLNGMYQYSNNYGTDFVIPNFHQFDIGPFAQVSKKLGPVELSGGVRYDVRIFNSAAMFVAPDKTYGFDSIVSPGYAGATQQYYQFNHVFQGFTGSIGASYNPNEHFTIKANFARGYRAPNIAEISANGVHPGTGFDQIGNSSFKPEFSLQEDLGVFYESKHITASVEAFNNNISNYIYDQKLQNYDKTGDSIFYQSGTPFPVFKYQQTNAEIYGGEIYLDIHPHPLDWLHFENSLSLTYGVNKGNSTVHATDSTRYLPFMPPVHGRSDLKATFKGHYSAFTGVFLKVGIDYYASQNRFFSAYGTETYTPGYVLLNAGFGSNITNKAGKTVFKLSVLGNNLTNAAYQSNMSRLKYFEEYTASPNGHLGIYEMGINVSIRVEIPLDFEVKRTEKPESNP